MGTLSQAGSPTVDGMFRIPALLALALTCLAVAPASASAVGWGAPFQVSVEGEVRESWNYWENADGYSCEPRYEGSGSAVARFKSPKSAKLRIHTERGMGGRVPVDVTVERQGARKSFYRDPECAGTGETIADASGCGTVSYKASAVGFKSEGKGEFGFGIRDDRDKWNGRCPLAPDPLPAHDMSPLAVLGPQYGPRFEWQKKLFHRRRKTFVLKHTKRVVLPYTRSEFGGAQGGEYVAEIDYTITFTRTGAIKG
jgi:hypothetical protein